MADSRRRIDSFYAQIQDKPGEGARILGALKEARVNLLSSTAFPIAGGRAQLDFVPEESAALWGAARFAGLSLSPGSGGSTPSALAARFLHGLGEGGDDLEQVAHHADIGDREDGGVSLLVDRHDVPRPAHPDDVLDGARYPARDVKLRVDGHTAAPDLVLVR